MKEPSSAEYTVRIGRLTWTELWILGGRSVVGIALLAPTKVFGSRRFDRTQVMHFDRPLGVGSPRPQSLSEAAEDRCHALEQAGFSYWGAENDPQSSAALVSYRQNGILAQIAGAPATPPIVVLFSFGAPRIVITADGESGIRAGSVFDKLVLRGVSVERLIEVHRIRASGCDMHELSEPTVIAHFSVAVRAAFHLNVARGVYEVRQNG